MTLLDNSVTQNCQNTSFNKNYVNFSSIKQKEFTSRAEESLQYHISFKVICSDCFWSRNCAKYTGCLKKSMQFCVCHLKWYWFCTLSSCPAHAQSNVMFLTHQDFLMQHLTKRFWKLYKNDYINTMVNWLLKPILLTAYLIWII